VPDENASASNTTSTAGSLNLSPPPSPGLTQADVDRAAKAAAKQGAAEAKAELDAYLAEEARKADLDKLDAASKAEAERDAALAKVQDAEQRLAKREHDAVVNARLLFADVPGKTVADVSKLVEAPIGADEATIDAAVAALRERLPQLFTPSTQTPQLQTVPTQQNQPPVRTSANTIDPARERARQRHGFTPTNAA
jgi:hypothetical protein